MTGINNLAKLGIFLMIMLVATGMAAGATGSISGDTSPITTSSDASFTISDSDNPSSEVVGFYSDTESVTTGVTETFSGDGTTTTFTVSTTPIADTNEDGTIAGDEVTATVGGSPATISSVNPITGEVTLSSAPSFGTDNVEITYDHYPEANTGIDVSSGSATTSIPVATSDSSGTIAVASDTDSNTVTAAYWDSSEGNYQIGTVTVDTKAPSSISVDSPSSLTYKKSSETLDVGVSYTESNPDQLDITLKDGSGNTATYTYTGESSTSGVTKTLDLSSPDSTGSSGLQDGSTYQIEVSATDAAGNSKTTSSSDLLSIDDTAPTGDLTPTHNDDANSGYDNDTTVDFSWNSATDAGSGVDHYNVYVSTDGGSNYGSQKTETTTSYSVSATNGDNVVLKVEAVDSAGNIGTSYESNVISVDTDKPGISSASITNAPINVAKSGVQQTVTVNFDEDIDQTVTPIVKITGTNKTYDVSGSFESAIKWNGTVTIDNDNEDVTAEINVSGAEDLAGNVMNQDVSNTFDVDTEVPSPSTSIGGKLLTGTVDLTSYFTTSASDVATKTYEYNSNEITSESSWDSKDTSDGNVDFTLTVEDEAGNTGSVTDTATVDNIAPTLDSASKHNDTAINVTISDGVSGIHKDSIGINDFNLTPGSIGTVDSSDVTDSSTSQQIVQIELRNPVDSDSVTVELNSSNDGIKDKAGNSNTSGSVTANNMDGVAPTITLESLKSLNAYPGSTKDGDKIEINVTVIDSGTGVDIVTADMSAFNTSAGDNNDGVVTLNEESGNYIATVVVNSSQVDEGKDKSVNITANDTAGNENTEAGLGSIDVDFTEPTFSDKNPISGSLTSDNQQLITINVSDTISNVDKVKVDIGNKTDSNKYGHYEQVFKKAEATMKIDPSEENFKFEEEIINVTVTTSDKAKNGNNAEWSFEVNKDPSITSAETVDIAKDGKVDQINLTMSEAVNDSNSDFSSDAFSLSDGTVEGVVTGETEDDDKLELSVSGISNTSATPTITMKTGYIADSDEMTISEDQVFESTIDGAAPVLLHAEIDNAQSTSSSTYVTATFSEPVVTGNSPSMSIDGSVFDTNDEKDGNTSDNTYTVKQSSVINTGDLPEITAVSTTDNSGNSNNAVLKDGKNVTINTFRKTMDKGWNFVSFPIANENNPSVENVMDTSKVEVVWKYNDGNWKTYNPDKSADKNDFTKVEGGVGYLVNANEGFTMAPNVDNIKTGMLSSTKVYEGWNLVGHYQEFDQRASTSLDLEHLGEIYTQSTGLSATNRILTTEDLNTGNAYWISIKGDLSGGYQEYLETDGAV